MSVETTLLYERIRSIFPHDTEALFRLCLNKSGYPLGFHHPDILSELAGVSLNDSERTHIRTAYIFLSSYYFLLDAVADGHTKCKLDALYLTQLFSGFWLNLERACSSFTIVQKQNRDQLLTEYFSKNSEGVLLESSLQSLPLSSDYVLERKSNVGRGNSFLLFYELLCFWGQSVDEGTLNILADLVDLVQKSDDLCDWEDDYERGRWTPLLKACFISAGRILTFDETEDLVYCSGIYEENLVMVTKKLEELSMRLEATGRRGEHLRNFVVTHLKNLKQALWDTVAVKLSSRTAVSFS